MSLTQGMKTIPPIAIALTLLVQPVDPDITLIKVPWESIPAGLVH